MFSKIPTHYLAAALMCIWGGVLLYFNAVRLDAFAIDEGAAHALLLNWSIADKIVNSVATFGGPDFRALLFFPLGLYWPGSIIAAKVFTIIISFLGVAGMYYWSRKQQNEEVALIATGLLLIAPVTIQLADQIAVGPYLLLMFMAATWLDGKYRASPHSVSSLYFLQCILIAITVTFHPMGLAYPVALAWHWYNNPKPGEQMQKQQKQVWLGIGIAVFIILAMQTGWIELAWFRNPAESLNQAILGFDEVAGSDATIWPGYLLLILVFYTAARTAKSALTDFASGMLLAALVLGLCAADGSWAFIAILYLLYFGLPLLIRLNQKLGMNNFIGQRGLVFLLIIAATSLFMQVNKSHAQIIASGILSARDQLIQTLAQEAKQTDQAFLAASEWPARTMIICKRDVLRLPPAAATGEELLKSISGITHVMFNHQNPANSALAKNFSEVTTRTETLAVQDGGVIIKIRQPVTTPATGHPQKGDENQQETTLTPGADIPSMDTAPLQK